MNSPVFLSWPTTSGSPPVLSISWRERNLSLLASSLACTLGHSRPLWRFRFLSKRAFKTLISSSRCCLGRVTMDIISVPGRPSLLLRFIAVQRRAPPALDLRRNHATAICLGPSHAPAAGRPPGNQTWLAQPERPTARHERCDFLSHLQTARQEKNAVRPTLRCGTGVGRKRPRARYSPGLLILHRARVPERLWALHRARSCRQEIPTLMAWFDGACAGTPTACRRDERVPQPPA